VQIDQVEAVAVEVRACGVHEQQVTVLDVRIHRVAAHSDQAHAIAFRHEADLLPQLPLGNINLTHYFRKVLIHRPIPS